MRLRLLLALAGAAAAGLVIAGQQQPEGARKLKVVPRMVRTRPEAPTRGASDTVYIDRDGNLVVEGTGVPEGRPFTFHITRHVQIEPRVASSFRESAQGYEYQYRIANGAGAKQWIQMFWMDVHGPVEHADAPPYWHVYNVEPRGPQSRIYIGRMAADSDERERLVAGAEAGPFIVRSAWRPGLVTLRAMGHIPGSPFEDGKDPFAANISDWLRGEINKALMPDNDSVAVYTFGPKIPPGLPAFQPVHGELLLAARLHVFSLRERKAMLAAANLRTTEEMRAALQSLAANAAGVPAEFYGLLLSYLK